MQLDLTLVSGQPDAHEQMAVQNSQQGFQTYRHIIKQQLKGSFDTQGLQLVLPVNRQLVIAPLARQYSLKNAAGPGLFQKPVLTHHKPGHQFNRISQFR